MSAGTTRTGAPTPTLPSPASAGGSGRGGTDANQWLTAVLVALATFMEILDTTIANVALRYIAGGLSATVNDGEWVMTSWTMLHEPA